VTSGLKIGLIIWLDFFCANSDKENEVSDKQKEDWDKLERKEA